MNYNNKKNGPKRRGQIQNIREHGISLNYSTVRKNAREMRKIGILKNALVNGGPVTCSPDERHHLDAFLNVSGEMDRLLLSEYPAAPAERAAFLRKLDHLATTCSKSADEILAALKLGTIRIGGARNGSI